MDKSSNVDCSLSAAIMEMDFHLFTNLTTVCAHVLNRAMKCMDMNWYEFMNVIRNCTIIHPQMKQKLEENNVHLTDDVFENETLVQFFNAIKYDKLDYVMAVDGLVRDQGPIFDYKQYIHYLRYPFDKTGLEVYESFGFPVVRDHVLAVRNLYTQIAKDYNKTKKLYRYVYPILRKILKEVCNINLKKSDVCKTISKTHYKRYKDLYISDMNGEQQIWKLVENLKIKNEEESTV